MRLNNLSTSYATLKNSNQMFFCNCLGEELKWADLNKISAIDSVKGNANGLVLKQQICDAYNMPFAFIFSDGKNLGAYDLNGNNYAPFKYKDYQDIHIYKRANTNNHCSDLFAFELTSKPKTYDVYHFNVLIKENVTFIPDFISDSFTEDKENPRYIDVSTKKNVLVYDVYSKNFLPGNLSTTPKFIHSKYEEIICDTSTMVNGNFIPYDIIYDFNGNVIATYEGYHLEFTELKGYYLSYDNRRYGLMKLDNNTLQEVISCKYKKILQVFSDKAVVITVKNTVRIIYFEQKLNKKTNSLEWNISLDKYKFTREIVSAYFLEDESEAILTLYSGKKILLSYFSHPYRDRYTCEEIIYEGNGVFKCFMKNSGEKDLEVSYIWNKQAVGYNSSKNDKVSIVQLGDKKIEIFKPNGTMLFDEDIKVNIYPIHQLKKHHFDFMTIPKKNGNNFIVISDPILSRTTDFVINQITGRKYDYSVPHIEIIWHNVFKSGFGFYTINTEVVINIKQVIAVFNDYMVTEDLMNYYIIDRNFTCVETISKGKVTINQIQQNCVIVSEDREEAFVISNKGTLSFHSTGITCNGKEIFICNSDDNLLVIEDVFTNKEEVQNDINHGFIDSSWKSVLLSI